MGLFRSFLCPWSNPVGIISNISILLINETLTDITTQDKRWPRSVGNKGVPQMPHIFTNGSSTSNVVSCEILPLCKGYSQHILNPTDIVELSPLKAGIRSWIFFFQILNLDFWYWFKKCQYLSYRLFLGAVTTSSL